MTAKNIIVRGAHLNRGLLIAFIIALFSLPSKASVVLQNTFSRTRSLMMGRICIFLDKIRKIDYLYRDTASYCASIMLNGKLHNVRAVVLKGEQLTLDFGENIIVKIKVGIFPDHVILAVTDVAGEPESLNFLNVPLTLEAMPYESFATCALSMNLYTHVRRLPALQPHLWATSYKRFGIKGATAAILGVPQKDILPTIRKVITKAKDIPFSDKGWGMGKECQRRIWFLPHEFWYAH